MRAVDETGDLGDADGVGPDPATVSSESKTSRFDLSPSQIAGGGVATLAAATTASYAGVYGTIIGAALMSVISTSGTAVAQYYLRRSGDKAKELATEAQRSRPRPNRDTAGTTAARPAETPAETPVETPAEITAVLPAVSATANPSATDSTGSSEGTTGDRPVSWWRRWRTLALSAVAVFLLVMAVITVFELYSGRSLSETVRGSDAQSAPTLLGGHQSADEDEEATTSEEPTQNTHDEEPAPASEPDGPSVPDEDQHAPEQDTGPGAQEGGPDPVPEQEPEPGDDQPHEPERDAGEGEQGGTDPEQ